MGSSKFDGGRSIGRGSVLVIVAVAALVVAVVLASPGTMGLAVAGIAAAVAVFGVVSITRAPRSAAPTTGTQPAPAPTEELPTVAASTTSPGAPRSNDAMSSFIVSLARRNGGLVDQQLALLDTLELSVEDPVLLADYFKLDHLATRMRRNADSLLVLAGVDRPGMRAPQDIDEVVRAGISEIEDYRRIDVLALDDAQVTGHAARTLGHLVAELLDNATAFSPSEARVRVAGNAASNGYEILVADSGIGISTARLDELNRKLSLPPELGAGAEASIGLTVVSMLAARIGATVSLAASDHGGTVATVRIPPSALHLPQSAESPVLSMTDLESAVDSTTPAPPAVQTPRANLTVPSVEPALLSMANPVVMPAAGSTPTPRIGADPLPARIPSPAPPSSIESSPRPSIDSPEPSPIAVEAANAIAKLTLTLSGLPIRPVSTETTAVGIGAPPPAAGMVWPPPAPAADAIDSAPNALSNALNSLQVADSNEPRPVMEAQPDRIGAAMASFAGRRSPTWDSFDDADRSSN